MYDRNKAPGRWISILYRSAQTYINFRLEILQLKRGQHRFLLQLFYKDGVNQGELAKSLSMDKGAAARALSKLEKAGYVKRKNIKNLIQYFKDIDEISYNQYKEKWSR